MKIGQVVGRVTLNHSIAPYRGGRFFLVIPMSRKELEAGDTSALPEGNSTVVYDNLGADIGDRIAFSEGGEACMAFCDDTPVDAYNCMILEKLNYAPPRVGDTE
mgnify:CR=1 FL=1